MSWHDSVPARLILSLFLLSTIFGAGLELGTRRASWKFYSDLEERGIDRESADELFQRLPDVVEHFDAQWELLAVQSAVVIDAIDGGRSAGVREHLTFQFHKTG